MISTQSRIDANRRNAQRSTGPKTPEGKARSRANSLKHGLCASQVVPEDAELVQNRCNELFEGFKPQNGWQAHAVDRAAVYSLRLDRCDRMERRARDKAALRAELTWDDDRKLEAELLGKSLVKDPALTVENLKRTPQGCDWLINRWALLAHHASNHGDWTEDQVQMAFDLMATPASYRKGNRPGTLIDHHGRVVDDAKDHAAVARREVDHLLEHRAVVAEIDEVEKALVCTDLANEGNPEVRRLRRYENSLYSKLRWFVEQIKYIPPYYCFPNPQPQTKWESHLDQFPAHTPEPEPPLKPLPKTADEVAFENWSPKDVHPPFDLTPAEIPPLGQSPNIPAIMQSRRETRATKAEERRVARRQKVDKLRA